MTPRYWLCPNCKQRNERVKQKCATPGCSRSRPKPRTPRHARTLQDDAYSDYVRIAAEIHGVTDESCCVCGRPRHEDMRHHRDHGHAKDSITFGKPRGLACFQCNKLMPVLMTAERAQAIADYLTRADTYYAKETP